MPEIWVGGHPRPQGSKTPISRGGRTWLVEKSKYVGAWRDDIARAVKDSGVALGDAPAAVVLTLFMPRPKDHYGTGRNSAHLKDSAPGYPATRPDVDKLARAVLDAMKTGGAIADDGQVVLLSAGKLWAHEGRQGVLIDVKGI